MKLRVCLALVLCVSATQAFAQQGPEDVVRAFFKAEDEGRWLDAARFLNLRLFAPIRKNVVEGMRRRGEFPSPTVESMMRLDPSMPRAVAEYQVQESQRRMREYDYIGQEFARVRTVDSLEALPLDEAAARWLEARGPEWRTELASHDVRSRPSVDCPGMSDSAIKALQIRQAKEPHAVIRGSTPDTGTVSYVVVDVEYHNSIPDSLRGAGPLPRAIRLTKVSGLWKVDPAADLPNSNGRGGMWTYAISCRATGSGSLIGKPPAK